MVFLKKDLETGRIDGRPVACRSGVALSLEPHVRACAHPIRGHASGWQKVRGIFLGAPMCARCAHPKAAQPSGLGCAQRAHLNPHGKCRATSAGSLVYFI